MAFRNFSTISKFPYSLLLLLLLLIILLNCVHCQITTYKVAVFEHAVISASDQVDNREQAIQAMKRNIDIYNKTTTEARLKVSTQEILFKFLNPSCLEFGPRKWWSVIEQVVHMYGYSWEFLRFSFW